MRHPYWYQASGLLLLMMLVTYLNHEYASHLGLAGVVSGFLILVVLTTYYLRFPFGLVAAASAFLIINFFFVEPLYTWEVAELASWAALVGFLVTSIVISTLIRKLRQESEISELARKQAEFSKTLAEEIAASHSIDSLFATSCELIHKAFNKPVAIAQAKENAYFTLHQAGELRNPVSQNAINWAANSGKMAGPGTDNWPEIENWIIPFERLPSKSPALLIGDADAEGEHLAQDFRVITDQLSTAYHRLCNMERARQAELRAHEESIHNTLLASISHDMRTPLTGIIGATGTLLSQWNSTIQPEAKELLESILSEAEHLACATENVLSLVHLEANEAKPIELDWQSPEEIVGILMMRYRARGLEHRVKPEILDNSSLIRGNATLLTQALMNLIENALAVQPESSPVIVRVHSEAGHLNISILDEGPGFPEEFHTESVGKFASYRDKRKRGFGLGLAIASAVARKHHAELQISAREPVGSCVSLCFPADMAKLPE